MPTLFERIVQWLAGKVGSLLIILAILLAVGWIKSEWARQAQEQSEILQKQSVIDGLRADLGRIEVEIDRQETQWNAQKVEITRRFEVELRQFDARIAETEKRWSSAVAKFASVEKQASEARRAADAARQRRDALEKKSRWWDIVFDKGKIAELEKAKAAFFALDAVARTWERARDRIAPQFKNSPVEALTLQKAQKSRELANALAVGWPGAQEMLESRDQKRQEIAAVESLVQSQLKRVEENPTHRLLAAAKAKLPVALWILVGLMLAPFLVKAFLYGVFAPMAEKLAPIRIIPNDQAPEIPEPVGSAVSIHVEIGPNEELFLQSDFVQSSSKSSLKRTQWLLNPRIPFSSIASGMFALTRIRSEEGRTTRVVVSSQTDPLGEVGLIEIPAGAAMIVQPRSLAGVVKHVGVPVRITRHWRLSSLHAWLTLQLRYLAFHGPCKLILKGCRGVRSERPEPGQPRLINQAATIGFSANLDYKVTRCETFVSYLRGKEELFNDLFAGGPGCFVYEEMPAAGRKTGIAGRGLEGVIDAFLKAFGI